MSLTVGTTKSEMETSSEASKPFNCNRSSNENNGIALTSKHVIFQRKDVTNSNDIELNNGTEDITLIVNDQKLSAHKNVLSLNSDYFDRMFTSNFKERDQDKIEINITDVSHETLKSLIEFFYTSTLVITEVNVQELLICSNIFLLEDVREACVDYLKSMIDADNCINMKDFANSLGCNDLYTLCLNYIINNFRLVANNDEFMTISSEEIMLLIKNDNLFAREEMVYDVVMNWIKHDPVTRSKYSPELLWYVRLPLVLNTYQGVIKVHEFQGARINGLSSFRMEHRKPFRKGILMLSHYPIRSPPEWYDAALDQWQNCICENCQCKSFQTVLSPPRNLCSCNLLDDGHLFAAGGYEYGKGVRLADMFDPKTNEWICLAEMHFERVRPYIVQQGSKVFVVGGCTTEKPTYFTAIEYYDLKKKKWFAIKSQVKGSTLRNNTYVANVNGLIYIIGLNDAGFYNPQNNSWKHIPHMPEKIEGAAVCTLNSNIYIIGGHNNESYFKSVFAYCMETKKWVSVADMNSPRACSGAVAMNGFIYVFGGKTDDESYSNSFEVYNPHANEWVTSNALMNMDRCFIDAIVIDKSCVLFKKVFEDATNNIIH